MNLSLPLDGHINYFHLFPSTKSNLIIKGICIVEVNNKNWDNLRLN